MNRIRHFNIIIEIEGSLQSEIETQIDQLLSNENVHNFIEFTEEENNNVKDCQAIVTSLNNIIQIKIKYRTYCKLKKNKEYIADQIKKIFPDRLYAIRTDYTTHALETKL